jgi:hypothetical protein
MNITVFDKPSGRILRTASVPIGMATAQLLGQDEDLIDGHWPDDMFYISGYTPVAMGLPPSPHHTFNYITKQWEDPRTLDEIKTLKKSELKVERDREDFGGFEWNGHRFDSNQISQQRIGLAIQEAMFCMSTGLPFSKDWTLENNTVITLTANDMIAVGLAMGQNIRAAHEKYRLLKQQLAAANTIEEIELVNWGNA